MALKECHIYVQRFFSLCIWRALQRPGIKEVGVRGVGGMKHNLKYVDRVDLQHFFRSPSFI